MKFANSIQDDDFHKLPDHDFHAKSILRVLWSDSRVLADIEASWGLHFVRAAYDKGQRLVVRPRPKLGEKEKSLGELKKDGEKLKIVITITYCSAYPLANGRF